MPTPSNCYHLLILLFFVEKKKTEPLGKLRNFVVLFFCGLCQQLNLGTMLFRNFCGTWLNRARKGSVASIHGVHGMVAIERVAFLVLESDISFFRNKNWLVRYQQKLSGSRKEQKPFLRNVQEKPESNQFSKEMPSVEVTSATRYLSFPSGGEFDSIR